MPEFEVIVLAAGGSSRLGHPKQLVRFEDEPLVRRAARIALESCASRVKVVVGAFAPEVVGALEGLLVDIVENPNWQLGLGSSIRRGVAALGPTSNSVVLTLCDVPHLYPALLTELAEAVRSGNPPIAAAEYNCHLGPPCAFHRSQFAALRELSGDVGARKLIASMPNVARIEFPGGVCDVDTPEDLAKLHRGRLHPPTN